MVLDCSGGWVQHLGVFARLYSLVCICLPVEVRALPAVLPRDHLEIAGLGVLYISSLVKLPLSLPGTGRTSRESTAYSQETAPPLPAQDYPGMSGHAETPAGTAPKYRPDRGFLR